MGQARRARTFAQFIPRATQDVTATADPILQRRTLRPGEAKRPVKVMQPVTEQELIGHPSARNTAHHTPDSAQMTPLQGAFPGHPQADTFCVSLTPLVTAVGGHAFDIFIVSLTPVSPARPGTRLVSVQGAAVVLGPRTEPRSQEGLRRLPNGSVGGYTPSH